MLAKLIIHQEEISSLREYIRETTSYMNDEIEKRTKLFEESDFFKNLKSIYPNKDIKLDYIDEEEIHFLIDTDMYCKTVSILSKNKEEIIEEMNS